MMDGQELLSLAQGLDVNNKNYEVLISKLRDFIEERNALQEKTASLELYIENKLRNKTTGIPVKQEVMENITSLVDNGNTVNEKLNIAQIQLKEEEKKKSDLLKEKDVQIVNLENRIKELNQQAEKHRRQMEKHADLSAALQNELQASYKENESLSREMEMLNLMFAELEQNIVTEESSNVENDLIGLCEGDGTGAGNNNGNGLTSDSCYDLFRNEGSHKVISISKTFIKLKGLIMEKKNLEGQLSKMKNVYKHLCSQVNIHEEKLCNITDELNNTWFYVSKIKEQHKKLHSSEQILRAELAEKRQLLSKLRTELEESKQSMNEVKQKTAESERQWIALKADFAQQKKMLFEDDNEGSDKESSINECDIPDEELENMEIPDPFSDEEPPPVVVDTLEPLVVDPLGGASNILPIATISPVAPITPSVVFMPPASFLANVPTPLQPPLFFDEENPKPEEQEKEKKESKANEEVDDNITDLITRLMSSTARGAFLANRLSDIHKRIAAGEPLLGNCEDDDEEEDDDNVTEADADEPDDSSEQPSTPAPDTDSEEIEEIDLPEVNEHEPIPSTSRPAFNSQISVESIQSDHTEVNSESAQEQTIDDIDPVEPLLVMYQQEYMMQESSDSSPSDMSEGNDYSSTDDQIYDIPPPPPPPPYSLAPPAPTLTVRPMYNDVDDDSDDSYSDRRRRNTQSPESSTAVTRFLIKHLPKQLSKLRNEKSELEDKIRDLEFAQTDQKSIVLELERRLRESEKVAKQMGLQSGPPICQAFTVVVRHGNRKLIWNITNNNEVPPAIWTTYQPIGDDEGHPEVLPSNVTEVATSDCASLVTTLETFCAYSGIYTIHAEGTNTGKVTVKLEIVEHFLEEPNTS